MSDYDVHLWVRAYTKDKATVTEIAEAAGVRETTVRKHLRDRGVKLKGRTGRPRLVDEAREDALLAERERDGTSYEALATKFGIHSNTARKAVKRAMQRRDGP